MMSLNIADALRQKLQEEHDFNAEQANGTLLVVDEMVDSGIDRVLGSIESLRTEMAAREERMLSSIASVRSEMDVRFKVIDDRFNAFDDRFNAIDNRFNVIDNRFNVIDNHLKTIEAWVPTKSAFITIAAIAAFVAIFGDYPSITR